MQTLRGLCNVLQNLEPTLAKNMFFGQIFNVVNGQILKNNLATWSHWQASMRWQNCRKGALDKTYFWNNIWTSGQSYNHFTIVNYDSSVVIWGIFK